MSRGGLVPVRILDGPPMGHSTGMAKQVRSPRSALCLGTVWRQMRFGKMRACPVGKALLKAVTPRGTFGVSESYRIVFKRFAIYRSIVTDQLPDHADGLQSSSLTSTAFLTQLREGEAAINIARRGKFVPGIFTAT